MLHIRANQTYALLVALQHFEGTAATLSILSAKALVLDPIAAHIRNAFSPRLENLLVILIWECRGHSDVSHSHP